MKLIEQFEIVARQRRLAQNSIDVYSHWIKQFLSFCAVLHGEWKHPTQLGTGDVESFLNDLVIQRRLSASAQNQALCALVFLYGRVLEDVIPQQHLGKFLLQRSRRVKLVPTVLSADEVRRVIDAIEPTRVAPHDPAWPNATRRDPDLQIVQNEPTADVIRGWKGPAQMAAEAMASAAASAL